MIRKVLVGGLLLAGVCFMTVEGASQEKKLKIRVDGSTKQTSVATVTTQTPVATVTTYSSSTVQSDASLDQLTESLTKVKAEKADLERRFKEQKDRLEAQQQVLVQRIRQKIVEQRQLIKEQQQKLDELLEQVRQIEGLPKRVPELTSGSAPRR
jgi:replicative DNA helicase